MHAVTGVVTVAYCTRTRRIAALQLAPLTVIDHDISVLGTFVDKLWHDLVEVVHRVLVDPRLDLVVLGELKHFRDIDRRRSDRRSCKVHVG